MKTVIFFKSSDLSAYRKKQAGALAYAKEHNWNVYIIEPAVCIEEVSMVFKLWNPDGCIVFCGSGANNFDSRAFAGTPTVFVDRPLQNITATDSYVYHDSRASAVIAAKELLSLNCKSYAYIHWTKQLPWDKERLESFREVINLHANTVTEFQPGSKITDVSGLTDEFADFIKKLKKPCGIFAATDLISSRIANACRQCGFEIPEDVAIIGIDNDEEICEHSKPSLSSIAPDYEQAGRQAATMLDCLMNAGKCEKRTYGPIGIVRRESTRTFAIVDKLVSQAVEHIRKEACHGLSAQAALKNFNCSRRMAELRFRRATGHSVLEEIQSVKLTAAQNLLRTTSYSIDTIANSLGYSSSAAFSKFFKSETNISPSQWRKSNRADK
jgi:LacI family transcriptional regulator